MQSLELGAQIETTSLILRGISFDSNDNALAFIFDHFEHVIQHPPNIYVDFSKGYLQNIEVTTKDCAVQIIKFKDPLSITFVRD